jgi:hypothetical protein
MQGTSNYPQPTFDSTATLNHGQLLRVIKEEDRTRVEESSGKQGLKPLVFLYKSSLLISLIKY